MYRLCYLGQAINTHTLAQSLLASELQTALAVDWQRDGDAGDDDPHYCFNLGEAPVTVLELLFEHDQVGKQFRQLVISEVAIFLGHWSIERQRVNTSDLRVTELVRQSMEALLGRSGKHVWVYGDRNPEGMREYSHHFPGQEVAATLKGLPLLGRLDYTTGAITP